MEKITFKPKYSLNNSLRILSLFLVGVSFLYMGYTDDSILKYGYGCLMTLMGIVSLFSLPKEIIFTSNQIIVKQNLLPSKFLEYREFTDISPSVIKFGRYSILLIYMRNTAELISIFNRLIEERTILTSQIRGELAAHEILATKAAKYSIFATLLIGIVGVLLMYYFNIEVGLFFSITIVAVFPGIYFITP